MRPKLNFWLWYWAFATTLVFLTCTGLISEWGKWYSQSNAYREQTTSFLRGALALYDTPTAEKNDLVWYNGGVQQVWGLGVPVWRFPFEILARLCGRDAFPDRLAFGAAYLLTAFLALRISLFKARSNHIEGWAIVQNPLRLVAAAALIAFPPFAILCRYRFDVYEEAVAYGYLYGIGLFAGVLVFANKATTAKYFILCSVAGFAPFVRPTVGAYGLISIIMISYLAWKTGFKWWQNVIGWAIYICWGALLFFTNEIRFGSGFEFGHNLNLNGFPIWLFTRIYNPFQHEPLWSAGRELFGSLFCVSSVNGFRWDQHTIFWGQSSTPRWRHFYLSCFDLTYLPLLFAAWGRGVWRTISGIRMKPHRLTEAALPYVWSLASTLPLVLFYLRAPVMSNRYVFDFAPSFAVALWGLIVEFDLLSEKLASRNSVAAYSVFVVFLLWLGLEFCTVKSVAGPAMATDRAGMLKTLQQVHADVVPLPNAYNEGTYFDDFRIPYNGAGWTDGDPMSTVVVLFVSDPNYLEAQFTPAKAGANLDYSNIKAKVGLEFLERESMRQTDSNCVVRFKGPKRAVYQKGIQVVFLAYVDPVNIASPVSPLRLLKVQWKDD